MKLYRFMSANPRDEFESSRFTEIFGESLFRPVCFSRFNDIFEMGMTFTCTDKHESISTEPVSTHKHSYIDHDIILEKATRDLKDKYSAICFSSSCSNPLMWGHYADKGAGVCIEIEASAITITNNCTGRIYAEDISSDVFHKVEYTDERPSIGFHEYLSQSPSIFNFIARSNLLTKAIYWKYEQEYRVLYSGEDGTLRCIISRVLLGPSMKQTRKDELRNSYPHIVFEDTFQSRSNYSIIDHCSRAAEV